MIDCAIVGDSIALGIGTEMQGCTVNAALGIPSAEIIGRVEDAAVLVVSAGSNDSRNPQLEENLRVIRERAHDAKSVIWIAPADPRAAQAVLNVARSHGDKVVHFKPRADHIHPASYGDLAFSVFAAMSS
jgi:hypothetical protein